MALARSSGLRLRGPLGVALLSGADVCGRIVLARHRAGEPIKGAVDGGSPTLGFSFAALRPSSIRSRMVLARDATRLVNRMSSIAWTSDFGIGVMMRSELGPPMPARWGMQNVC